MSRHLILLFLSSSFCFHFIAAWNKKKEKRRRKKRDQKKEKCSKKGGKRPPLWHPCPRAPSPPSGGGEKKRGAGALTCRHVALTSAALERQSGGRRGDKEWRVTERNRGEKRVDERKRERERGQLRRKETLESKGETRRKRRGRDVKMCPSSGRHYSPHHHFLPLSAVTLTGPVIGRGLVSLSSSFFPFSLSLLHSLPPLPPRLLSGSPRGPPEIADDKIAELPFIPPQGDPSLTLIDGRASVLRCVCS